GGWLRRLSRPDGGWNPPRWATAHPVYRGLRRVRVANWPFGNACAPRVNRYDADGDGLVAARPYDGERGRSSGRSIARRPCDDTNPLRFGHEFWNGTRGGIRWSCAGGGRLFRARSVHDSPADSVRRPGIVRSP